MIGTEPDNVLRDMPETPFGRGGTKSAATAGCGSHLALCRARRFGCEQHAKAELSAAVAPIRSSHGHLVQGCW
jgi:hypothetical protein